MTDALTSSHLQLDHIGILVADFDAALERYSALLGGEFEVFEPDEELDCNWARLPLNGTPPIEIVAPRTSTSPYARDLEKRGEGVHHLSFVAHDIIDERDRIAGLGFATVGLNLDHAGWQELFVHPRHTSGALLHLCIPPPHLRLPTLSPNAAS